MGLLGRGLGDLLDRAEEALLLCRADGVIVDINKAAERLYGYARGQLLNQHVGILFSRDDCQSGCSELAIAEKTGMRFVATHLDCAGHSIPVVIQVRRLRIAGERHTLVTVEQNPPFVGTPIARPNVMTAAGYALTQGKQVGEITASFNLISQFATVGMLLLDASGTILAVNGALCSVLGYTERELVGAHFLFCGMPGDLNDTVESFNALISGRIHFFEQERQLRTVSGAVIWARLRWTALQGATDRCMLCVCQAEDITREKRHRDQLNHHEALVLQSDVAIYSVDKSSVIRSWNPAAERTFGYDAAEAVGQHVSLLIPDQDRSALSFSAEQTFTGQSLHVETNRRHKDGHLVNVTLNVSPIRNQAEQVVATSVLARDITEFARLQREIAQLDRLNLVGGIAASLGHEVRNPMTTVRGYLQLMNNRPEFQRLRPQLDLMLTELDRMNATISDFLSFTQSQPAEKIVTGLNEIVLGLMPVMEAEAAIRGNEIVLCLGQIPEISIDPREIRQLLLNLVRNGLEAMTSGAKLTISTYLCDDRVVLAVADQGSGILPEHLDRLGTAFFTTKDAGAGIGLTTCYSIADRHRAKITVETGSGGSTFRVHFRLVCPTDNQTRS